MQSSCAIIFGFQGLGGVNRLGALLKKYGCDRVFAFVDDVASFGCDSTGTVKYVSICSLFEANIVAAQVRSIASKYTVRAFLCIQDRLMFLYSECLPLVRNFIQDVHVPIKAIKIARIKPLARHTWNLAGVDDTCWQVINAKSSLHSRQVKHGNLTIQEQQYYIVKPVCGMGSEGVAKVKGWRGAVKRAASVRAYYKKQWWSGSKPYFVAAEGCEVNVFGDVLIEEFLGGPEFTVDGFICGNKISFVVQHKESRVVVPFFGDGLIISPPDYSRRVHRKSAPGFVQSPRFTSTHEDFRHLIERGVRSIGLDDWVFHAEVIEVPKKGLRFVELNPRPAGGLLSVTAGEHLGMDLYELVVRAHLGIPNDCVHSPPQRNVTGQFPIYAFQKGRLLRMDGVELANSISGVYVQKAAASGTRVTSLAQENYLAYVSLSARSHSQVRRLEKRVRKLIRPVFSGRVPNRS